MIRLTLIRLSLLWFCSCLLALVASGQQPASLPPIAGNKAPDFTLINQQGKHVRLFDVTAQAPVVLLVLRGYPGYQCPLCNLQVRDFLKNAQGFADAKVRVILVYPGPPENLNARAAEFFADKPLPAHFELLLDPGYEFTNLYGLRWDAPKETAYPSTFLIDRQGTVFYAKVSKTHGGRTKATEILEELARRKAN